jgi:hypothetical protein
VNGSIQRSSGKITMSIPMVSAKTTTSFNLVGLMNQHGELVGTFNATEISKTAANWSGVFKAVKFDPAQDGDGGAGGLDSARSSGSDGEGGSGAKGAASPTTASPGRAARPSGFRGRGRGRGRGGAAGGARASGTGGAGSGSSSDDCDAGAGGGAAPAAKPAAAAAVASKPAADIASDDE